MRQLLKKGINWEWTEERNTDFNNLKKELTTEPCLAHYNGNKKNHCYNRHMQHRIRHSVMATPTQRRTESYRICQPLPQ